ncbi:TerC/Alx family metal homeostasis membrane protein [Polluticaenibacter yanchengensis]|uniref:TerC/Alx family metal homeostasis membrane protein n=1 Tax=Polluticaenibacter yanchengensis TaxID=3014562 RepID=A0ABT4UJK5_9BACT|nr:TerC/Alx family metal homeostasis membrane protein [Chitinophagaceae bacterium LY-5]
MLLSASLVSHPGVITIFSVVIIVMLLLDLGVFNKKSHEVSSKEALTWSLVWISLAMIFSGIIYYIFEQDAKGLGVEKFSQFQSAYWIEKALSVDNLFVFVLVLGFFKVPKILHHKVLFWGVIGALIFRAIFIFAGVEIINNTYLKPMNLLGFENIRINVVLTIFGVFLIYAGIKSWFSNDEDGEEKDFTKNMGARIVSRFFKVTNKFDGAKFFTVENGVRVATPLLTVIAVIEMTDLIFAVDSIPAIFAIAPDDPFILYTSNIFAILGLRSLYFLLANFMDRFSLLKYGLAIILAFIGLKMVVSPVFHIKSIHSLAFVASVLVITVITSLVVNKKREAKG